MIVSHYTKQQQDGYFLADCKEYNHKYYCSKKGGKRMNHFKLQFKLESNFLPKSMDKLILSYLKAATMNYDEEMYNKLYDKSKSIIKQFTYSCYLPGAKFKSDRIELDKNEFFLLFSDSNQIELLQFFNAFQLFKFKRYPMQNNSMQLTSISMQKLDEIKDNEIVIKIQSPLLVRKHNSNDNSDIYYTCDTDGFEEALIDNVRIFVERTGLDVSVNDFSIQVIKGKKVIVPVFGRNTDASIGIYKLTGSCELLNILYLAGIGVRRSEGHGKFELIG